jgi:putative tricarboxylic transport membrane protein
MKFHDTAIGAVLIAFGIWVVATAWSFPKLTGQAIGPGTFPILLGTLCTLGGAIVALQGMARPAPLAMLHTGWRHPGRALAAVIAIGGAFLLALNFETIGFPLGGSLLMLAIYLSTGHRSLGPMMFSIAFVLTVHILLTRFLQVPLPSGLLKGLI